MTGPAVADRAKYPMIQRIHGQYRSRNSSDVIVWHGDYPRKQARSVVRLDGRLDRSRLVFVQTLWMGLIEQDVRGASIPYFLAGLLLSVKLLPDLKVKLVQFMAHEEDKRAEWCNLTHNESHGEVVQRSRMDNRSSDGSSHVTPRAISRKRIRRGDAWFGGAPWKRQ